MKIAYIPYNSDEMNDVAFSSKFNYRWSNYLKKMLRENGHEIHTYDILPFEEADAILSFDNVYFQNMKLFSRIQDCNKLGVVTHIDYEPPSANCKIHDDDGLLILSKLFKNLITYNDNVIGNNIIKGCIADFYTKEKKYKNDFKKRKLITVLANYRVNMMLFDQHPNELYSKRGEAVKFFQEKCPKDFDLYGNYWPEEYKKCYISSVDREHKQEIISKYRFLISYDSLSKQNGYISEKIFDCFNSKTVPIYWGADNVTDYIPKDCFIDKRDFDSYDDLYNYLVNMTEDEYNVYIKNIEKFLHSEKYKNLFSSQASARIIYNSLMMPKINRNTTLVKKIMNNFEKIRKSDIKYNYANNYYDYHIPRCAEIFSFDNVQKGVMVDYNFKFQMYSSSDNDFKVYYKYGKKKYIELPLIKEKISNVYNGSRYIFCKNVFDIIEHPKIEFFIKFNNKLFPLNIESLIPFKAFSDYFRLYYSNNKFYVKKTKKEKLMNFYLSRKWFRIICKLIMFPFKVIKLVLEVFYK